MKKISVLFLAGIAIIVSFVMLVPLMNEVDNLNAPLRYENVDTSEFYVYEAITNTNAPISSVTLHHRYMYTKYDTIARNETDFILTLPANPDALLATGAIIPSAASIYINVNSVASPANLLYTTVVPLNMETLGIIDAVTVTDAISINLLDVLDYAIDNEKLYNSSVPTTKYTDEQKDDLFYYTFSVTLGSSFTTMTPAETKTFYETNAVDYDIYYDLPVYHDSTVLSLVDILPIILILTTITITILYLKRED